MIKLRLCYNPQDPEKCVLPTIIFVNFNHSSYGDLRRKGFAICIGWWDLSVKLFVILQ